MNDAGDFRRPAVRGTAENKKQILSRIRMKSKTVHVFATESDGRALFEDRAHTVKILLSVDARRKGGVKHHDRNALSP